MAYSLLKVTSTLRLISSDINPEAFIAGLLRFIKLITKVIILKKIA